jgi:hypothetical protein
MNHFTIDRITMAMHLVIKERSCRWLEYMIYRDIKQLWKFLKETKYIYLEAEEERKKRNDIGLAKS